MSNLSKRDAIYQRRKRVAELIRTKSEIEISKILNVSRETIVRDISFLKKSVNSWLDDLAKTGFSFEYKLTLEKSKKRTEILENMINTSQDNFEKINIIKELRNEDKFYIDLLSQAPTVYSLRRAIKDGNVSSS